MTDTARDQEDVARQAIAWHVRLRDPIATAADRRAFQAWLGADPRHAAAYEEAERLWSDLQRPAAILGDGAWYRPDRQPTRMRMPLRLGAATAAILLLAGGAWWRDPGLIDRAFADHATAPGARVEVTLPDGSRAYLDGDTAISVAMDGARRQVTLHRGRAWFDAVHQPEAPFRVLAGAVAIRDIGTVFAVERGAEATTVTVEEGEVAVSDAGQQDEVLLTAGHRLRLGAGRTGTEAVDANLALAWRRGLIVFDRAPLSEVVEALDRMGPGRVLIADDDLRQLTLSGVFRADDRRAVLSALERSLGLHVAGVPGVAMLIRR